MYSVSAGFGTAVKANRELTAALTVNGVAFTGHLFSIQIDRLNQKNGKLVGNAVPQSMTVSADEDVNVGDVLDFSITLGTDTVPFVQMTVAECTYNERDRKYTWKAYDALYFATNSVASAEITLPCTMLQYIQALCAACGITLNTTNFYGNADTVNAVNLSGDETIASVIGLFAEACLCNAYMNRSNELVLKSITDDTSLWSLGKTYTGNVVGNVLTPDGVTLAREPQEGDDIMYPDGATAPFIITDNPFLDPNTSDADRLTKATALSSEVIGLTFSAYDMTYRCNFALDPWDAWDFTQVDGTVITTYYPGDILIFTGGLSCTSKLEVIPESRKAGTTTIADYIKDIYIKVDKANATIEQRIATVQDDITALSNTISSNAQQTEVQIQKTGGYNLIRNSAFYKDAEYWTVSGTYTVTINTQTERETDSGSRISINGSVTQTDIKTISGQQYTLAGTWDNSLTVTINGQNGVTTWTSTGDTTLVISGTGTFSDMRIVKGNTSLAWTQHADEMYGTGVLIDDTGVTVRSLSDNSTVVVDRDSVEVRDSGTTVAELSEHVVSSETAVLGTSIQVGDNILVNYDTNKWMVTQA